MNCYLFCSKLSNYFENFFFLFDFFIFFLNFFQLCGISDKDVIMRVFAVLGNMALNFHVRPQIGFMGGMKLISGELFFPFPS